MNKRHLNTRLLLEQMEWEITLVALRDDKGLLFKVTRRMPAMNVAETKLFRNKELAELQFSQWL